MMLAHFGYSIYDFPFTCSQILLYLHTKLDIYVCFTPYKKNLLDVVVVARCKAQLSDRLVVVMIDIRQ